LVTLNDPVYIEAAQALARRMVKASDSTTERARFGLRNTLIREPRDGEIERLTALFETSRERFAKEPAQAKMMAEEPLGPLPENMNTVDLAAWTVVANVLLNLDEVFLKR